MSAGGAPRIGVYIWRCGTDISGEVDVADVTEFARGLAGVVVSREYRFTCSEPGQGLIQNDIREHQLDRVVVVSCSPWMHESTFRGACEDAGVNPALFNMANIREHVSWVTVDTDAASDKARALVAAAVARAANLGPLERRTVDVDPAVMVVGAGIAGIQSALDIADAGHQVFLVEQDTAIGGHMARFDKTFPTLDCSACILTPKMVQVARHPNIKLLTGARVEAVSGFVGNYDVTIRQKARFVDEEKCTACGECEQVCPVSVPDPFEEGMTTRKAIYRNFPEAVPAAFAIDHPQTAPCKMTCPIGQDVQGYLALVREGRLNEAHALIRRTNPLPSVCGRVCYRPCEEGCRRALVDDSVAVRAIKRFVLNRTSIPAEAWATAPRTGLVVAIVGSGPAGLTAAHDLARAGHTVQIYERDERPGGMLRVGIPAFRLPRDVLERDLEVIRRMGVVIETGVAINAERLQTLREEFDAVFIATGAHAPMKMGIQGEELEGVLAGVRFLRRVNTGERVELGERVAVIGGGNTAIDAARVAARLGATVKVLYRRSREEMPASDEEIEALLSEGIEIRFLIAPRRFIGANGRVRGIELVETKLGEPDESGRRRPEPVPATEHIQFFDNVIPAVSQTVQYHHLASPEIELTRWNTPVVDHVTAATSAPKVFAGGDLVRGPSSVAEAMADGRRAATAIDNLLNGRDADHGLQPPIAPPSLPEEEERLTLRIRHDEERRATVPELDPHLRMNSFEEVELGLMAEVAMAEAARCLECGVCAGCRLCASVCQPRAIDYDMEDSITDVRVGSVILATGFQAFDASEAPEYGHGRIADVYTGLEFERMNSASGPTGGAIRTHDGRVPESVGIIHCVGSRDTRRNEYCSRVCCMYALKFAHLVREKTGAEVYNFYIDMRCFGKGHEEFYGRLLQEDVRFVRGRAALVTDSPMNDQEKGKLIVQVDDTLLGEVRRVPLDMVVLATGLEARADSHDMARLFGIGVDKDGFFIEQHAKLGPVSTPKQGVFIAGACQGPKDIPDAVAQASAAAAKALSMATRGAVAIESAVAFVDSEPCSDCRDRRDQCALSAITWDAANTVTVINEALCRGCGTRAAASPSSAIEAHVHEFTRFYNPTSALRGRAE